MGGRFMKKLGTIVALGMGLAFVSASAYGLGIPAKLKATKVQGNLVPAYYPMSSGSGTGDDEGDTPALLGTAVQRSANCTFTQGKFKQQLGKDTAVQLKGVTCMGTPFSGQLCAHTKQMATIMDHDIDKKGVISGAQTCLSGTTPLQGKINFTTGNIGSLTCSAGSCKGTLPVVTPDPCPDVDKVSEFRRLEVFDGNDSGSLVIVVGSPAIKACCGPRQTAAGSISVNTVAPCNTSTQDVLGEIGTVTQGVP